MVPATAACNGMPEFMQLVVPAWCIPLTLDVNCAIKFCQPITMQGTSRILQINRNGIIYINPITVATPANKPGLAVWQNDAV